MAPGGTSTESSGDEISTHSDSTDEVIELKGDQFQHMSDSRVNLSVYDIWALGLTTAMGGHFYLWSACLIAGFGSFLIATVIISAAFGCLVLSMAELAGSLPFAGEDSVGYFSFLFCSFVSIFTVHIGGFPCLFSFGNTRTKTANLIQLFSKCLPYCTPGGAYGVTRVTMGSYPGFLVACCDAYQSMFYTMLSVLVVGFMIGYAAETDRSWQPVYWLAIYASYVGIHAWGGPMYWKVMNILSIGSLLILVMYILGCIKYGDFDRYAPIHEKNGAGEVEEVWFKGGIDMFLKILPIPCWFFVGIESVNLAAHDTQNPKRDIPRGYVSSYITVLLSTLATIFVAVSVFPGSQYLPYSLNPQSWAFMKMFDINLQHATALSIAPIYTSGFGFTYYYASQVRAMGKSGLAPLWLGYDIPHRNTPVPALIFGAIVGFLIGLRYFFWEAIQHESLFSVSLQGAVIVYCSQFISFIMFRLYYPTIKREFVSPVGIAGAIFGICVFLLVFIILAGLEASPGIIAFAVYIAVLTAYYFLVVVHRQIFSEEEKTVLFKAYLMKCKFRSSFLCVFGQDLTFCWFFSYFLLDMCFCLFYSQQNEGRPRPHGPITRNLRRTQVRAGPLRTAYPGTAEEAITATPLSPRRWQRRHQEFQRPHGRRRYDEALRQRPARHRHRHERS